MSQLIGQDAQERDFLDGFASGKLHHAWLLTGPKGVGKAAFAKRAALFLLEQTGQEAADSVGENLFGDALGPPPLSFNLTETGAAHHLVEAGTHPEFHLLERKVKDKSEDLARNIPIDQVRALIGNLNGTPSIAHYRICIVDAIDDLERSAANALLKTLEEPPRDTIFFLISHAPGRLLPTIRSRCRTLRFPGLPDTQMLDWAGRHWPNLPEHDRTAIVRAANGSPGRAIEIAGLSLGDLRAQLQQLIDTGDSDNAIRHGLAKSLSLKAARPRYEAMLDMAPMMVAAWTRQQSGAALAHGLATWERLETLTERALPGSYDVPMTVYETGTLLAGLAQRPR